MPAHLQVKAMLESKRLQTELEQCKEVLIQMNGEEFLDYVMCIKRSEGMSQAQAVDWIDTTLAKHNVESSYWQRHREKIKLSSSFIPTGFDVYALNALASEIKQSGKAFTQYRQVSYSGNKPNIILKNYINSRKHLTASKYIANKPKTITLATGIRQARGAVKGGLFITVIVSGVFHAVDQLLNDKLTWHHFVGGMAVDVALAVAATGITLGATSMITAGTAIAATGPLVVVILVGILALVLFDIFIDTNQTETLSEMIAQMLIASDNRFRNNIQHVQREFIAVNELRKDNLETFLRSIANVPDIKLYKTMGSDIK